MARRCLRVWCGKARRKIRPGAVLDAIAGAPTAFRNVHGTDTSRFRMRGRGTDGRRAGGQARATVAAGGRHSRPARRGHRVGLHSQACTSARAPHHAGRACCIWARRGRPRRPTPGVASAQGRQASGDRSNAPCRRDQMVEPVSGNAGFRGWSDPTPWDDDRAIARQDRLGPTVPDATQVTSGSEPRYRGSNPCLPATLKPIPHKGLRQSRRSGRGDVRGRICKPSASRSTEGTGFANQGGFFWHPVSKETQHPGIRETIRSLNQT